MKPLLINTTLTLFEGPSYTQYDTETGEKLTPSPRPIADGWTLPFTTIDAALNWGDGAVYFVRTMQVVRYSIERASVEPGYPKPLPFYWRGLWASDIDAAFRLDDFAHFFRRNEYIQYDINAGRADLNGPIRTTSIWNGLPKRVTGAVPLTDDYLLFTSKQACCVYDLLTDRTVAGPLPFAEFIQNGVPAFLDQLPKTTPKPRHNDRH